MTLKKWRELKSSASPKNVLFVQNEHAHLSYLMETNMVVIYQISEVMEGAVLDL